MEVLILAGLTIIVIALIVTGRGKNTVRGSKGEQSGSKDALMVEMEQVQSLIESMDPLEVAREFYAKMQGIESRDFDATPNLLVEEARSVVSSSLWTPDEWEDSSVNEVYEEARRSARNIADQWLHAGGQVVSDTRIFDALKSGMSPSERVDYLDLMETDREAVLRALVAATKIACGSQGGVKIHESGTKDPDCTTPEEISACHDAAKAGDQSAQYQLGLLYQYEDDSKSISWFRKAAEQGHAEAQSELGTMYWGENDLEEALRWWRKGAENGIADAQLNLGGMYDDGDFVPKDYVLAYMWLSLSAARGNGGGTAEEVLEMLVEKMTKEQIAEAQRMASEWQAKHSSASN